MERELDRWDSFFGEAIALLQQLDRRAGAVDLGFLDVACRRLDEALSTVDFLATVLRDDGVVADLQELRGSLETIRTEWQEKSDRAGEQLLQNTYSVDVRSAFAGPPRRGRPPFQVSEEQIRSLRDVGFTWPQVAALLGVSPSTVERRRVDLGIPGQREKYSTLSSEELDGVVAAVLAEHEDWGERMVAGALKAQGLTVQRQRLRASISRVDPVNRKLRWHQPIRRRPYSVPCPNALWHIDSYMKLVRWGFVIHGGIDGYSRMVVYLSCGENNRSNTVRDLFVEATTQHGVPSRVRGDYGGENNGVEEVMMEKRGFGRGSFLRGSSVHNQRIERLWRDIFVQVIRLFYRLFYYLEEQQLLDLSSSVDMYALQYTFLPRINRALLEFVSAWNHHQIRTANALSPVQLFTAGLFMHRHSGHTALDVLHTLGDPMAIGADYGLDWDGPPPDQHPVDAFPTLPHGRLNIDEEQLIVLKMIDPCAASNNYGIDIYDGCRQTLHELGFNS